MAASHTFAVPDAARDDAFAVGAERHAAHTPLVSLQDEALLALLGVPHLCFTRLRLGMARR